MSDFILHIPHNSTLIPNEYRNLFLLDEEELKNELLRMTDLYTDKLFDFPAPKLIFPVSRLVCDVERFRDRSQESMTQRGMWVCYSRTSSMTPLKEVTSEHVQEILFKYYDPHHERLTCMVDEMLLEKNCCTLIDCHSFPSKKLPYEMCPDIPRPSICLGTDEYHTPPALTMMFADYFRGLGYSVGIDHPFSGTLVPIKHYRREPRVRSIMIEVNRRLYINEKTCERLPAFEKLHEELNRLFSLL